MSEGEIHPASIVEETRRRYLNYALSVIQSRALPDVRDGLKPVQRRILYTMYHDLRLTSDAKPRKCMKIAGEVMGNYHPHGDQAIYDALVRMAQDFVMRFPLVDGHGNFGSVDGDAPAAARYTEARLTPLAEFLMSELNRQTVETRDNYDGTRQEPVVLPAQFPNLLVNGASGIAVGMATNIPPHNLSDVIRACILLIDDPSATTAQLLDRLKGPDFPLGGQIITDRPTLRQIYETGSGTLKIQGEWKLEKEGRREAIVITSIPYGVTTAAIETAIGEIIAARKLPQLIGINNESNSEVGLRIVLEIKTGTDPDLIMAYLYKHTPLQENFAVNMTCLVPTADGVPQPRRGIGLKEILQEFLAFRFKTVRRRFEYDLEQLRKRIHILEGFRKIFNALDEAIRIIRRSDGKADAGEKLKERFHLDDVQVNAILEIALYRLAKLEIRKILDELKEKKGKAAEIEKILASDKRLWGVIKDELGELRRRFGERRRTRFAGSDDVPEFDPEAYIIKEDTNVVVTQDGWIKRVGRLTQDDDGNITTRVREGDAILAVVPGSTRDQVVFLADDGTAYTMPIAEVPASSGYGEPIAKFFRVGDGVRLVNALGSDPRFLPKESPSERGPLLVVVTAKGHVLRLPLEPYFTASTRLGRRYVRLSQGDRVVFAQMIRDETSMFLATEKGRVIHFPLDEVNILSGAGKGVMGIKLAQGDRCLGAALISNRFDAMRVATTGGKILEFRRGKYEVTSRGGKGFQAVKRTQFERVLPPPVALADWDAVLSADGDAQSRTPNLFE